MKSSNPSSNPVQTWQQEQNAYFIGLVLTLGAFIVSGYSFTLALQGQAWQLFATAGISLALTLGSVTVCALIRKGNGLLGTTLLLILVPLAWVLVSVFSSGMGLALSLGAFVLVLVGAPLTLPYKWIGRLTILGMLSGILIQLLDSYTGLAIRIAAPAGIISAFQYQIGGTVLIMAVMLVWQRSSQALRTKLILPFMVVSVLSAASVAVVSINNTREALTSTASQTLSAAASQTAATVESFIEASLIAVDAEAQSPVFSTYLSLPADQRPPEMTVEVANLLASYRDQNFRGASQGVQVSGFIQGYRLLDSQGQVLADTTPSNIGQDMSQADYFRQAMDSGRPYVSPVLFSSSSQASWFFSSCVLDAQRQPVGVLVVSYDSIVVQEIIKNALGLAGENSYPLVLDENYLQVANGVDSDQIYTTIAPLDPGYASQLKTAGRIPDRSTTEITKNYPELQQGLASLDQNSTFQYRENEGEVLLGTAAKLNSLPWWVVYAQPEAAFLAPVENQLRTIQFTAMLVASLAALAAFGVAHVILAPIQRLTAAAERIISGDITARADVSTQDEVGALGKAFNAMTQQLHGLISSLEQRVTERTQELEKRTAYLQASAEVSQATASILDPVEMVEQAVRLIRERFFLYYVGLFLLDENREWAVLRAGTGDAGRQMLARGHRLIADETSMIGWCITNATARVALEAGQDAVRLATVELPNTRSEAALPLRSRGLVIGAISVQSEQADAFPPDLLAVLQMMADQLAVALDNASLFAESRAVLDSTRQAYGDVSRAAWERLSFSRLEWSYRYAGEDIAPVQGDWSPELAEAVRSGEPVRSPEGSVLAMPVKVRNHAIGALSFRKKAGAPAWQPQEVATLEKVLEQVGQAVESARLYQETQLRAQREQMTSEVTARIRETLDIETVLKTAVHEVQRALGLPEVVIRLGTPGAARIEPNAPAAQSGEKTGSGTAGNGQRAAGRTENIRSGNGHSHPEPGASASGSASTGDDASGNGHSGNGHSQNDSPHQDS